MQGPPVVFTPHVAELRKELESPSPILNLGDQDDLYLEALLRTLGRDADVRIYAPGLGLMTLDQRQLVSSISLEGVLLNEIDERSPESRRLLWLRDASSELAIPGCIGLLKRLASSVVYTGAKQRLLISGAADLPNELARLQSPFDLSRPRGDELTNFVGQALRSMSLLASDTAKEVATLVRGLDAPAILQVLRNSKHRAAGSGNDGLADAVRRERDQHLRRSSVVKVVPSDANIRSIGGLRHLTTWLEERADMFALFEAATAEGVKPAKGVLLVGMPGCGKSLAARVTAGLFQVPLLCLDMGQLMGKYLGESEANLRAALSAAEAAAPCVLWVDELEKALAGSKGGSDSAGGTASRMLAHLLSWMQESERGVFMVATANAVNDLPPELLRRGRFDEFFFVDLPNERERLEIIDAHLHRLSKWTMSTSDRERLARESVAYTGADLETLLKAAVEDAWLTGISPAADKKPALLPWSHVDRAFKNITPLGKQWASELDKAKQDLLKRGFRLASCEVGKVAPERRPSRRANLLPEVIRQLLDPSRPRLVRFDAYDKTWQLQFCASGRAGTAVLAVRTNADVVAAQEYIVNIDWRLRCLRLWPAGQANEYLKKVDDDFLSTDLFVGVLESGKGVFIRVASPDSVKLSSGTVVALKESDSVSGKRDDVASHQPQAEYSSSTIWWGNYLLSCKMSGGKAEGRLAKSGNELAFYNGLMSGRREITLAFVMKLCNCGDGDVPRKIVINFREPDSAGVVLLFDGRPHFTKMASVGSFKPDKKTFWSVLGSGK